MEKTNAILKRPVNKLFLIEKNKGRQGNKS